MNVKTVNQLILGMKELTQDIRYVTSVEGQHMIRKLPKWIKWSKAKGKYVIKVNK